jgi:hypothetical protein
MINLIASIEAVKRVLDETFIVRARYGTRVLQNEYVIWSQRDQHHIAY